MEGILCTGCNICTGAVGQWRGIDSVTQLSIGGDGQVHAVYDQEAFRGRYDWTQASRAIAFSGTGEKSGRHCSFTAELKRPDRIEGTVHCRYAAMPDFWTADRARPAAGPR
jgi:hypothetical protein